MHKAVCAAEPHLLVQFVRAGEVQETGNFLEERKGEPINTNRREMSRER